MNDYQKMRAMVYKLAHIVTDPALLSEARRLLAETADHPNCCCENAKAEVSDES